MAKAEISWNRLSAEGIKRQVYAQHVGNRWIFFQRQKRYDQWQQIDKPSLEDWLELLDGVRRRIQRRLIRPEEEGRLKKIILENFPDVILGA